MGDRANGRTAVQCKALQMASPTRYTCSSQYEGVHYPCRTVQHSRDSVPQGSSGEFKPIWMLLFSTCVRFFQIAVPVSGDQPSNADYLKRSGVGETIQFQRLSEDKLYDALQKVLNDPSYKAKITDLGSLLVDQIDKPLDRAVWWIEHLIRHPSLASHMRSPVHNLTWYQYYLLDVLALILSVILTVLFIFYKILKCICCRSGGQDRDLSKKRQWMKRK